MYEQKASCGEGVEGSRRRRVVVEGAEGKAEGLSLTVKKLCRGSGGTIPNTLKYPTM